MAANIPFIRKLEPPYGGTIIRVPMTWLKEGKHGPEIQEVSTTYDVEMADGKPLTVAEHRLKLATPIEILLFF